MKTKDDEQFGDLVALSREDYISKYYPTLRGQGVSISDAAREIGMSHQAVSMMVARGLLRVVGTGPNRVRLVDRGDVAHAKDARRILQTGNKGQKIYSAVGVVYIPKLSPA